MDRMPNTTSLSLQSEGTEELRRRFLATIETEAIGAKAMLQEDLGRIEARSPLGFEGFADGEVGSDFHLGVVLERALETFRTEARHRRPLLSI